MDGCQKHRSPLDNPLIHRSNASPVVDLKAAGLCLAKEIAKYPPKWGVPIGPAWLREMLIQPEALGHQGWQRSRNLTVKFRQAVAEEGRQ